MSLSKQYTLPNGAVGSYWKINAYTVDAASMRCNWQLSLYADKDHADAENAVTLSLGHSIFLTDVISKEEKAGDLFALGYAKFKAGGFPELEEATDA